MSAIYTKQGRRVRELNQALRNRDKMKDDAIAQLSDQVMALTARACECISTQEIAAMEHVDCY